MSDTMNTRIPNATFNNGVPMPMLGLGTYLSPPGDETKNSVIWALEAGYRKIDTASFYENEESVGAGLKESGVPRDQVFLTTKLWNTEQGYDNALEAFDRSRRKLDVDYVDLYLIHWPIKESFIDSWKAFEKLYADGAVRAIGLSNFEPKHIDELTRAAEVQPVLNQVELHPYLNQSHIRDHCRDNDIVVEAWSPIAKGGVTEDAEIRTIAEEHRKTPAQVTLRWELQHGVVVIPKSVHKERIRENMEIFDFELSSEEMERIDQLDNDGRLGPVPDEIGGW
jgi:diketogulonate reductase-like aldo/keto reductase